MTLSREDLYLKIYRGLNRAGSNGKIAIIYKPADGSVTISRSNSVSWIIDTDFKGREYIKTKYYHNLIGVFDARAQIKDIIEDIEWFVDSKTCLDRQPDTAMGSHELSWP